MTSILQHVFYVSTLPSRDMTVTGNGKVTAQPDVVQIQLEVRTEGNDVNEALQENAHLMNQVLHSLTTLNIPKEDIQTASFNVLPQYDYIDGKQIFKGYEVTNALTVRVRDSSLVGTVIDTAVRNGANRISAIQFQLEDADAAYQQALRLALQNAQIKANTIAETMMLPVKPIPIEIIEVSNEPPIAYKSITMAEQAFSTPIEQGVMTISATVKVKFQF